jgi:hypothetical protein
MLESKSVCSHIMIFVFIRLLHRNNIFWVGHVILGMCIFIVYEAHSLTCNEYIHKRAPRLLSATVQKGNG